MTTIRMGTLILALFLAASLALVELLAHPSTGGATFPGFNGMIAWTHYDPGASFSDIYVMDPDGTNPTNVTETSSVSESDPAWSPDGARIAFARGDPGEIWVMDADGSNPEPVVESDGPINSNPVWSPDGSKIAFDSFRNGTYEIWVVDANGSNPDMLTGDSDRGPDWSPDGSKIAFTSNRGSGGDADIYVMDADGSDQVPLTDDPANDQDASWSPDGTHIAFLSSRGGSSNIWIMDPDGDNEAGLTDDAPDGNHMPAWSPDGTRIVFTKDDVSAGVLDIYTLDIGNLTQVNLTNGAPDANNNSPSWQRLLSTPTPTPSPTPSPSPPPTPTPTAPLTPTPTAPPTPTPTASPIGGIHGDADCSGDITGADIIAALSEYVGLPPGTSCFDTANADCDEDIDPADALRIARFLADTAMPALPQCPQVGDAV